MTELTPERIRDAAEVVAVVRKHYGIGAINEADMCTYAATQERAKLDRARELALEIWSLRYPGTDFGTHVEKQWVRAASTLIDRYPALFESSGEF